MLNSFNAIPFKSVGPIEFGCTKDALLEIMGKPDYIDKTTYTDIRWKNLAVKLNKKDVVTEISFIKGELKVFFDNIDMLNEPHLDKMLGKLDSPEERLGFKVYYSLGISITGFSKPKEAVAITFFTKDLLKWWKKFISAKK